VSVDLAVPLMSAENSIQGSLYELRRGYQAVADCLEDAFSDCDVQQAELNDCQRQLAEARRNLAASNKQLAERNEAEGELLQQCAALKKQFEAKQAAWVQATEAMVEAQTENATLRHRLTLQAEAMEQLRGELQRVEADRNAARAECLQWKSQPATGESNHGEIHHLRQALAAAQEEIHRLSDSNPSSASVDGLTDALLIEQVAALEAERRLLEAELDMLRHRGADLAEALADQKRQATLEHSLWSEELRQLRRAIEQQLGSRGGAASGRYESTSLGNGAKKGRVPDLIVDAVREQLESGPRPKSRKASGG